MSLLLDALKKAAEQKAEKSKQEEARARSSDETVVDAGAGADDEDRTDVRSGPPRYEARDETEIDNSEIDTRLEPTRAERDPGDDTGLDVPDPTATDIPGASAQMQTGEDETIIFDDDDVSDYIETSQLDAGKPRAPEDETDLSQLAEGEDATDVSELAATPAPAGDDTDISRPLQPGDQTDVHAPQAPRDETDLLDQLVGEDETDISEPIHTPADLERVAARGQQAEDTDLSRIDQTSTDTDLGRVDAEAESEPDPSLVGITESGVEFEPDPTAVEADDTTTGVDDADLSLLLVERDQTNLTSPTSLTDPQAPHGQPQALQSGDGGLGLVDQTGTQTPGDETTTREASSRSSATATTGINYETQGTTRTEPTSTRTYAPDNYDRTLMRLPSDDASKLFAGMKSDSDVVMTPDYAKKVFQSKSSAQRVQHYKFYAGIAVVILLGIGIYGAFEYQDESVNIDNSLQPLKRDPMPGMVRTERANQNRQLFTDPEPVSSVDERTISIIQSAGELGAADGGAESAGVDEAPAADAAETGRAAVETGAEAAVGDAGTEPAAARGVVTAPAEAAAAAAETAVSEAQDAGAAAAGETVTAAAATGNAPRSAAGAAPRPAGVTVSRTGTAAATTAPIARAAPASTAGATARPAPTQDSRALQISSSTRVADKSIWLRQAYEAYLAGNDELALELYNKVLEAHPQNRNALLARAAINVQNNNARAAIADYQTLLEANPKDSLAMASLISVANVAPRQAETQLKLMLRDEPESPYLNFALANAYSAQKRWREAQAHYFRALQANPGDPNYAYNLAVSLEHISQPRAAVRYYRRALDNINNGLATFNKNLVEQRLEVLGKS